MTYPEGVQLGPDAQTLLGSHPAVLRPIDTLGIGMVGEPPDAATSLRFAGIWKAVVRRSHGPTRLARIVAAARQVTLQSPATNVTIRQAPLCSEKIAR